VAFAFDLSLRVMAYAIGPTGCHVNPAVTVGLLLSGKCEAKHVPGFVITQIVGAIIAGGVLLIIAKQSRLRSFHRGARCQRRLWRSFIARRAGCACIIEMLRSALRMRPNFARESLHKYFGLV